MAALWSDADRAFMERALRLAQEAADADEVPVGAVLVQNLRIIGEGRNRPVESCDPTAHAEVEALRKGALLTRNFRIAEASLYVSLEPCIMCAGALIQARVSRLVFAARDLRFGAVRSKFRLADSPLLNHRMIVEEGLLAAESASLLQRFFEIRRTAANSMAKKMGQDFES